VNSVLFMNTYGLSIRYKIKECRKRRESTIETPLNVALICGIDVYRLPIYVFAALLGKTKAPHTIALWESHSPLGNLAAPQVSSTQ
jgi:hypothetical protein